MAKKNQYDHGPHHSPEKVPINYTVTSSKDALCQDWSIVEIDPVVRSRDEIKNVKTLQTDG